MGNEIENCESYSTIKEQCIKCKKGYGIGGHCEGNKCKSCIKCGSNCNSCRKCICTDCAIGRINPYDLNNCIEKGDDSPIPDYSNFECGSEMIKLNLLAIIIILLLFKIKFH